MSEIKNQERIRQRTLESFHEASKCTYSTQLARNISNEFSIPLRQKIKRELEQTEEEAKLAHLKLLAANQKKHMIQQQEEMKRAQMQKELIDRQQRSMKMLEALKQEKQKGFLQQNERMRKTIQRHYSIEEEQLKNALINLEKKNQQMETFYLQKERRRKTQYIRQQTIAHKHNSATQPLNKINPYDMDKNQDRAQLRATILQKIPRLITKKSNLNTNQQKELQTHHLVLHHQLSNAQKEKIREAELSKQQKNLNEYGKKMEEIQKIRNKKKRGSNRKKKLLEGLPHLKNQEDVSNEIRQNNIDKIEKEITVNRKKYHFSEDYIKKVEMMKRFLNKSLEKRLIQGEGIMQQQLRQRELNKMKKLLNQSKNEVIRRVHFSFMETMNTIAVRSENDPQSYQNKIKHPSIL